MTAGHTSAAEQHVFGRFLGAVGQTALSYIFDAVYLASVLGTVLVMAVQPCSWRRTVRYVLVRQLYFTGVCAIWLTALVASMVGIVVVLQAQLWLGRVGQTEWLGPLLVVVVLRELAPLLTNLVVVGRSGSAMTAELASMTVNGEVRMLDALGLDPFVYLLMPRVVATVVATMSLLILFIATALASGYLFGFVLGLNVLPPVDFANQVLRAMTPMDGVNLLIKGIVPPLLTGIICCTEGLGAGYDKTAIPIATRRALVGSVAVLFIVCVLVSVMSYL